MPSQINASNSGFGGIVSTGDSSGVLELQTTGTTAVTINTSQNVGIGTTSPTAKLDVRGAGFFITDTNNYVKLLTDSGAMEISRSSGDAYIDLKNADSEDFDCRIQSSGTAGDLRLSSVTSQQFYLGGTERMRIDSSGNVLIGQSTNTNGARLAITGNGGGTTDDLTFNSTASTSDIQSYNSKPLCLNRFGNEVWINGSTDRGGFALQVNSTGVWGAGAYTNGSDARIKEDITPLDTGLDVVAKLNPVTYKYKEEWSKDQSIQTGFIAQDLIVALEGKNYVDGIVNQSSEYMSVAYQNIIPILTKAIQEQQTIINDLKARIETLEAK